MLQLLQNLGSGETLVADVPAPLVAAGTLLIATSRTLVSAGTERMLVDFGRASMLEKARQQPEKVKMVLDKVRTDGLFSTLDAVRSKLDQPLALGYCNVGTVVEVGRGVQGFRVGDRVASNGPHAELVRVPQNLCARVPDGVDDASAAFTVLASIGLQGLRLVAPTLGECVVVTGLGLIGLVTVQLLRASGCRVLGIDLDPARIALARQMGAEVCDLGRGEDPVSTGMSFSAGRGVDAVIVTASTKSSLPIEQAARMSRKRGRIVLVGVTGLELSRADFYEKELTFQVSCSYGPGRYDASYEADGHDYPFGLVRWTEQRNFEAVLAMMDARSLDVQPLITHRFPIRDAARAYDTLVKERTALGILLEYDGGHEQARLRASSVPLPTQHPSSPGAVADTVAVVAMVGAGNYGSRVLIPALKAAGARLDTLITSAGVSGFHHGSKAGFSRAATDFHADVLESERVNSVVIASRHDTHAGFATDALRAGKHVFVEKPLAITLEQVAEVEEALARAREAGRAPVLMVGFNRRFSPLVVRLQQLLAPVRAPRVMIYTVNAGAIPPDHWTQKRDVGGGRLIGEGCHFIDLLRHIAAHPVVNSDVTTVGRHPSLATTSDKYTVTLRFADGSLGTIHYLANGGKAFPKERLEIFCNDGVLVLENYVRLRGFDWKGFSAMRLWKQDKGQKACAVAFVDAVRKGGPSPIPAEELFEVARLSIELADRS